MDLDVVFLGTGGSVPTARRATACVLVRRGGEKLMFDCGEGSQRQLQRSLGLVRVDSVFVTHYHLDHVLGLPGLIKTYDLQGREEPLRILGPRGLHGLWSVFGPLIGRTGYEIDLVELEPNVAVPGDGYEIHPFEVEHRARAIGYALVEHDRPGHFDVDAAKRLGVAEGPDFGRLQRGQEVEGSKGTVKPEDVLGEIRASRRVVITGDTAPCGMTRLAAEGANLLVHDASFADEEADRARKTGHSTGRQAAELAGQAGVDFLALVHVSSRYDIRRVLDEAREEFPDAEAPRDFDVVQMPYPEQGKPRLIKDGARAGD